MKIHFGDIYYLQKNKEGKYDGRKKIYKFQNYIWKECFATIIMPTTIYYVSSWDVLQHDT